MIGKIKKARVFKQISKTIFYARVRQLFPGRDAFYYDDSNKINDAEVVLIDWPDGVKKPTVGMIKDYGIRPRWTKYCRFLENNAFEYGFYNIHASDWIEKAADFDIIVGVSSCEFFELHELRKKFFVLENYLGKSCYPSARHILMYDDKGLEAYVSKIKGLPFANSFISYDKQEAARLVGNLPYPVVSKIDFSSGSVGVELVRTREQAQRIVKQAFSASGRGSHLGYFSQKNNVYFQEYIPNDGYDIRVIVVGNWVFGYYRKVLAGDFRASGMDQVEKRELPEEAMRIALEVNKEIQSPQLVIDMVRGLNGKYYIVEFSILCQMEFPEQLHVKGIPGVYIFEEDGSFQFKPGRYWVHELALREFLMSAYLPRLIQ